MPAAILFEKTMIQWDGNQTIDNLILPAPNRTHLQKEYMKH